MSLSLTLYTTTSPTSVSRTSSRFHRNSRSPRWKAGSMEPERTTTMGEGESVRVQRPFHIFGLLAESIGEWMAGEVGDAGG